MNTKEIIQGTDEWHAARCGSVGASAIADLMAKGRGNAESAGLRNLRARIVAERLTGEAEETFVSQDMQNGIDREDTARKCYEFETDSTVEQVGLIRHPSIEVTHASPDGIVGEDGLIEIKCPKAATHLDYLMSGEVPGKYAKQIQWQLACTERQWCDFVSYSPSFPEHLQLKIIRVNIDYDMIAEIESKMVEFQLSVDNIISGLEQKCQ